MNWAIVLVWHILQFFRQSCSHITKAHKNLEIWAMTTLWLCMNCIVCAVSSSFYDECNEIIFFIEVKNGIYSDDDSITYDETDNEETTTTTKQTTTSTTEIIRVEKSTTENVEITTGSILWSAKKTDSTTDLSTETTTVGSNCESTRENTVHGSWLIDLM